MTEQREATARVLRYTTKHGAPVQAVFLPGGVADVTWEPEGEDAFFSRETWDWVESEVKYGWLIPVSAVGGSSD